MDYSTPGLPVVHHHPQNLLKLKSIEWVMPSSHLILCHPFYCLQSFLAPGSFQMSHFFASGGQSIGVSASISVLPMNIEDISFRVNCLHLLAVQETLKRLLQHHSLKASILQHSAFFMVQHSHPYMTTGKTTVLTRWKFVGKECFCFLICFLDLS